LSSANSTNWLEKIVTDAHDGIYASEAQSYLHSRGLTLEEMRMHQIGYVPPAGMIIAESSEDFSTWSQQFLHSCLVFPMHSMLGDVIGLQVRDIGDQSHTRPYKQFYLHHRDLHPYFFGLPHALPHVYRTGYLIIVEGIFDYFAVRTVTPNVVAVMTSGVPVACKRFFNRFCGRVVALLDMDEPGREGAQRLADSSEGQNYQVVIPTYSEKDPAELLKAGKHSELTKLVLKSMSFIQFNPGNTPGV
jgi:DNA primase